jgi:two-component system, NarL family, nitrate/nitrite response regulator NarL
MRERERSEAGAQLFGILTDRERMIAASVAEGLSNKAIGERFAVSEGTVKIHLHNIYQKLGVNNRTSLAAMALGHAVYLSRANPTAKRE